jgi:hypothetical protein
MTKTKHNNKETVVKCPVNGCDHEGLSRGMHLHVRQSSGDGHGPNGDTPDNLNLDTLEVVGEQSVEMDYPDERAEEDVARLCPYCGGAFNGFRGIKIHVGQKAGQGVHPDDATDIEKDDCPIAHVDENMNVIELVEENEIMPSTKRRILEEDSVNENDVIELIEEFENEGDSQTADRIRSKLL